jgi:hypothetical protein
MPGILNSDRRKGRISVIQPQFVKDVGVAVGVDVGVRVFVTGVFEGVWVNVGGTKGVFVMVGVKVLVEVGVDVMVGVLVGVNVGVNVAVRVMVAVFVAGRKGVCEAVGVSVMVLVWETVPVRMLGVRLPVAVRMLSVPVSEGITKRVLVAVALAAPGSGLRKYATNPKQ